MSTERATRRRVPGWVKGIVAAVLVVLLANLLLGIMRSGRGGPSQDGPGGSSYVTTAGGLAAYEELLRHYGHGSARSRDDAGSGLRPEDAAVLWEPDVTVTEEETVRLRRFVEDGGRLVVGLRSSTDWLEDLLDAPPTWEPGGSRRAEGTGVVPESDGVGAIEAAGTGSFADLGETSPVVADGEVTLVTATDVGAGRVVLFADASILENQYLAHADNARLGLTVLGAAERPVVFLERAHGFSPDETGLDAVPTGWKIAFLGVALAAIVGVLARGRRIGPPEELARALPPPRRAYVDSMGSTLARTKDTAGALAPMRDVVRRDLAAQSGLGADATDEQLRAAAARLGWPVAEIDAALGSSGQPVAALALGRALARVHAAEEVVVQQGGSA